MSSPDRIAGEGEDVVLEGNGKQEHEELSPKNGSSASSNGEQSSELSEDYETESSDDEDPPPDAEGEDLIPERVNPEEIPSPTKKMKQDVKQQDVDALVCEVYSSDPEESPTLKRKAKKGATSSAPLLLSPDPREGSTSHQASHSPEEHTGEETAVSPSAPSVLQAILRSPTLLPVQDPPEQSVPSDSDEIAQLQDTPAFNMIMGSKPLSPLQDPPASRVHDASERPSTQSPGPGETSILRRYLVKEATTPSRSPEDVNAPNVSNPSEGNKKRVSDVVRNSPTLVKLLSKGQSPSGTQSATSLDIPPQTSGHPSTSEPKNEHAPSTGTTIISNIQEDSSEDSEGISSEEHRLSSVNISSEENSVDVTDDLSMEIDDGNVSAQTKGRLTPSVVPDLISASSSDVDETSETKGRRTPSDVPDLVSASSSEIDETSETKGRLTPPDVPDLVSASSSDVDDTPPIETPQFSKRSTRSASQRSKNPASAPDEASGGSSEASLDDGNDSKRTGRMRKRSANLESTKQGDSSKVGPPGRKSRPLQETKKSSVGETSSGGEKSTPSAPELPPAVDPDDKIFKKPSVTPLRLQKMKSRLEDMNLGDSSATSSPARRSARIQSKEGGEGSKEGKNLRPRPGGRAPSEDAAKASEKSKSLSRERISKLKTGARGESVERTKTRSREDPRKTRKQDTESRARSSSEESVASRTRGARLASSSSEADKTEEDDNETPGRVRKSRKDSRK